ncbi:MAG: NlpC/P60 family protein [Candidatus Weimeria sp.]
MKRYIAMILSAVMIISVPVQVPQVTAHAATSKVKKLQKKKQEKQEELNDLQSKLVDIISQIDALESDIKSNAQDIKDTQAEVKEAKKAEKKQYEAMKSRIRYFYENDTDNSVFNILVESKSLTDFINKVSYMNSVYSYDRDLLDAYEATRVEIEGMEEDLEDKQLDLKKERKQLKANKSSLNNLIDSKKDEVANISAQVAKAKKAAAKAAAEKAAKLEKEREARNAAAAAAAAERAASRSKAASSSSSSSSSSNNSAAYTQDADPSPATDVSGSAVVSYALQFVGNPYVWGGNSLTNGCDCSGFVVQIYRHFGIDLSGSRNSAALRYVGQAVSPDNIQAGDIVCYPGHVAIYAGNGCIVEAQSSKAGITSNRAWNHGTVVAIRRVI